jgi:hypothetical protein
VDGQPNKYNASVLREWKTKHERWVAQKLQKTIPAVTFEELEMVCKAIASEPGFQPSEDFSAISPSEKIKRNNLSGEVSFLLRIGIAKAGEVKSCIDHLSLFDSGFPERLKAGFIKEYKSLKEEERIASDELFYAMFDFASSSSDDFSRKAAGLAVLSYLFLLCEVFER